LQSLGGLSSQRRCRCFRRCLHGTKPRY
jgi:hypothetical protein